ncbi:MAG: hypothetical protein VYA30_02180 [Myxococcota bacterium]|nr:hypothetical protein [Myxococcota bacterium]
MTSRHQTTIGGANSPTLKESFWFPVSTPEARRDLIIGGTSLIILPLGWILNLGHRLDVIYRLYHDQTPYYRGFKPYGHTMRRGLQAVLAILVYLAPSLICAFLAYAEGIEALWFMAVPLFLLAIYILPGGMTYNAAFRDISYLYRPDRAFARALDGGKDYLWAWLIALSAIIASFVGLLGLGIGFLYTSVWAWMVVGYAFSRTLSLRR